MQQNQVKASARDELTPEPETSCHDFEEEAIMPTLEILA